MIATEYGEQTACGSLPIRLRSNPAQIGFGKGNHDRSVPRHSFAQRIQRAEMMEFLRESREDIEAGRTEPALAALERLAKKHKLNRKGR